MSTHTKECATTLERRLTRLEIACYVQLAIAIGHYFPSLSSLLEILK